MLNPDGQSGGEQSGRQTPPPPSPSNVYPGYFPDGIEYCDLERARNGEYHKVAYFSYRRRELVIHDADSPLLREIAADAERCHKCLARAAGAAETELR